MTNENKPCNNCLFADECEDAMGELDCTCNCHKDPQEEVNEFLEQKMARDMVTDPQPWKDLDEQAEQDIKDGKLKLERIGELEDVVPYISEDNCPCGVKPAHTHGPGCQCGKCFICLSRNPQPERAEKKCNFGCDDPFYGYNNACPVHGAETLANGTTQKLPEAEKPAEWESRVQVWMHRHNKKEVPFADLYEIIDDILRQKDEEWRERIADLEKGVEGLKNSGVNVTGRKMSIYDDMADGFNQALDSVKALITNLKE